MLINLYYKGDNKMAKSNKIKYENAKVEIVDGQIKLTLIDDESGEIIQEGNLFTDVETV